MGQQFLDDLGFQISARSPLASLSVGQQQLVVCAKAVLRGTRLLILDEPTAFLSTQEAEQLERLIRRLHAHGTTFVYISHRMEEIFNLSDTVTVLRDDKDEPSEREERIRPLMEAFGKIVAEHEVSRELLGFI